MSFQHQLVEESDPKKGLIKKRIRMVLFFIFLFTTFSGAIRKWVVDDSITNNLILAVQLSVPFSFLFLIRSFKFRSPFKPLLIAYIFLLILLAINPMNYTMFHGVFGIILHLGFWFACFFYFENREYFDLRVLFNLFIIISLSELVLGFIQYTLPPSHILNKYVKESGLSDIAMVGGAVRVTGTFSYLAGFASFFVFYPLFIWALAKNNVAHVKVIFLYMLGLIGCFMSGSRSAFYPYLLIGFLILYTEYGVKRLFGVVASTVLVGLLAVTVTFFLGNKLAFLTNTVNKSYENFENRRSVNKAQGEEQNRILKTINGVLFFPGEYAAIGVGLGATYQGAIATWGTSPYVASYPGWLEEEPERIVVEGGFVLFFFRILLFAYLFRKLSIPTFSKAVLLVFSFFFISIVFFTYSSSYFLLGLILIDNAGRKNKRQELEDAGVDPVD